MRAESLLVSAGYFPCAEGLLHGFMQSEKCVDEFCMRHDIASETVGAEVRSPTVEAELHTLVRTEDASIGTGGDLNTRERVDTTSSSHCFKHNVQFASTLYLCEDDRGYPKLIKVF